MEEAASSKSSRKNIDVPMFPNIPKVDERGNREKGYRETLLSR